jgi:hypothetical protein
MRFFDTFSPVSAEAIAAVSPPPLRRLVMERRLNRVLSFTRLTIHDVVNSPIAKNMVRGYWKLSMQIDRQSELTELEKQWNPNGLSSGL